MPNVNRQFEADEISLIEAIDIVQGLAAIKLRDHARDWVAGRALPFCPEMEIKQALSMRRIETLRRELTDLHKQGVA